MAKAMKKEIEISRGTGSKIEIVTQTVEEGLAYLAKEMSKATDAPQVVAIWDKAKEWEGAVKAIREYGRRMLLDTLATKKLAHVDLDTPAGRFAVRRIEQRHNAPDAELLLVALEKKGKRWEDITKEEIHIVVDMDKVNRIFTPKEVEALRKVKSEQLRVDPL